MTGMVHLFEFVDEEADALVTVMGRQTSYPFDDEPMMVRIEVDGEYHTLDEFVHRCPCCGDETEVGR